MTRAADLAARAKVKQRAASNARSRQKSIGTLSDSYVCRLLGWTSSELAAEQRRIITMKREQIALNRLACHMRHVAIMEQL